MNNVNKILLASLFLVVGTFFISCKVNSSSSEPTSSSSPTSSLNSSSDSSSLNSSSDSSISSTVEIEKETLNFTMNDLEVTYDGNEHYLEINEELPEGVSVEYINNNQVNAGTYVVEAKFIDTTGNYEIEDIEATLIINKQELSFTMDNLEVTYDGEVHSLEVNEELPEGVSVEYTNNNQVNAGTYVVEAKFTDTTGNYEIEDIEATLIINKQKLAFTMDNLEVTYDGEVHSLEVNEELPEGVSVEYTNNNQVNAGTYVVEAKFTDTTGNYEIENIGATLIINKQELSFTMDNLEVTYDGEVHSLEVNEELPEGVSVEYTNNNQVNAGTYVVEANFTDTTGNYDIEDIQSSLIINKKEILILSLTINKSFAYDQTSKRYEILGLPEGVIVEYTNNDNTEIGTYDVHVKFIDTTGNYLVPEEFDDTYEIYNDNTYCQVTFIYDEGTQQTEFVKKGNVIVDVPSIEDKLGYESRWDYDFSNPIMNDENITLVHELINYNINYHLPEGVENSNNNPSTYTILDSSITISSLTDSVGSYFDGWYTTETFESDTKIFRIPSGSTGDIDLYPKFINFRIESAEGFTFNYIDYELPALLLDVDDNTNYVMLSRLIQVSEGCTWTLSRDIEGDNIISTKNMTLNYGHNYAYVTVWYSSDYNLVYLLDVYKLSKMNYTFMGDSEIHYENDILEKDYVDYPTTVPTKNGFTFEYWTLSLDTLEQVEFPYQILEDNLVFYPVWEINIYTIIYHLNDGVNNINNVETFTLLDTFSFYEPTRVGYTFKGWYLDEKFENEAQTNYSSYYQDIELYAKWEANTYKITYDTDGGMLDDNVQYVTFDQAYTLLKPIKHGYSVDGYLYNEEDFVEPSVWTILHDVELKVKWKLDTYIITYHLNGGENNPDNIETFTVNDTFEIVSPYKKGHTFEGWYLDSEYKTPSLGEYTNYYEDLTLYAKWSVNSYTITYYLGKTLLDTQTIVYGEEFQVINQFGNEYEVYLYECEEIQYSSNYIYTYLDDNDIDLYVIDYVYIGNDFSFKLSAYDTLSLNEYEGTSYNVNVPMKVKYNGKVYNVTSIGEDAFYGCSSLTSIVIPDSVTSIGEDAFRGCTSLKNVYYNGTINEWIKIDFNSLYSNPMSYADNLYTKDSNNEWIIPTEVVIPEGVTSIGKYAFYVCSSLTSIELPSTLTSIGYQAFYGCSSLTSIEIPEGVTSIGYQAFYGCSSLTSIEIPEGVTSIGHQAFYGCSSLTSIVIPDSVTSIGKYAFYVCSSLTSIELPSTLTSIGEDAFYGCSSLTSIVIPEGVISIEHQAFYGCSSLTSIVIPEGVTSIGKYAFYVCSSLTSIELPSTLTSIGEDAFYGCSSLTSIVIPEGVTSIGEDAFYGCSSLTSITLPASVTSIGDYAFRGCSSLTSIELPSTLTSIGYSAFYGCSNLTSIVIPEGVTSIGKYAFYGCSSLASIELPSTLTSIGMYAFSGCSSLTSITLPFVGQKADGSGKTHFGYIFGASSSNNNKDYVPSSLKEVVITGGTNINDYAFYNCSSLTSIVIPEGVTSIGYQAFYGCSSLKDVYYNGTINEWIKIDFNSLNSNPMSYADNLYTKDSNNEWIIPTEVVIPEGVTSIGYSAFRGCSSLTSIELPSTLTSIGYSAFYGCSSLTSIEIPEGVTSIGYQAFYGCSSLTSIVIPEGVTSIGKYAFYVCSSLTSIELPSTLTSIGEDAFYGCSSLTSIVIPEGVTSIGKYAFYVCSSLTSIELPSTLTSIGYSAFYGCSSLTSIVIPEGVTSIGRYAFLGCSSLASIVISEGVTSIGEYAFDGCSSLTSIELPSTLTSIGMYAFSGCSSLTSIVIPEGVTSIGMYAFSGCSSLTSITLPFVGQKADGSGKTHFGYIFGASSSDNNKDYVPSSLKEVVITGGTNINDYAFYNCSSLTSIELPSTLKSIGMYAFWGCSSLTSIVIPYSVTSIGSSAFYGCSSLTSIELPSTLTSIGEDAFRGCTSLKNVYYNGTINEWIKIDFNSLVSNPMSYADNLYTKDSNNEWIIPTEVVIPGGVTSIGDYAFYGCSSLTSIEIPEGVTSIGDYAFYGCSSLTSIEIPEGVTSIGHQAFRGCSSLTSIEIPEGVTSIGRYAFYVCSSLTSIELPSTLTSIGYSAFYGCSSLTSIVIPEGVTSIGGSAFYRCSNLTSITLPASVTSIGDEAFSECNSLKTVYNDSNIKIWDIFDNYVPNVYNKGEWEYINGVPTPLK